jgi:hypothetical protein
MNIENHGGMILTGEIKELGEKPVLVPLCPPKIPNGLTWAQTRASTVLLQYYRTDHTSFPPQPSKFVSLSHAIISHCIRIQLKKHQ